MKPTMEARVRKLEESLKSPESITVIRTIIGADGKALETINRGVVGQKT